MAQILSLKIRVDIEPGLSSFSQGIPDIFAQETDLENENVNHHGYYLHYHQFIVNNFAFNIVQQPQRQKTNDVPWKFRYGFISCDLQSNLWPPLAQMSSGLYSKMAAFQRFAV